MKLEVGMYVRTDKGLINKIKEFTPNYTKGKRRTNNYGVIEVEENYLRLEQNQCDFIESISYSIPPCYPNDEEWKKIKKHIKKASFNIIDLIEVGDFVNGRKVTNVWKDELVLYAGAETTYTIKDEDIEEILTKEQYNSNKYVIGDE